MTYDAPLVPRARATMMTFRKFCLLLLVGPGCPNQAPRGADVAAHIQEPPPTATTVVRLPATSFLVPLAPGPEERFYLEVSFAAGAVSSHSGPDFSVARLNVDEGSIAVYVGNDPERKSLDQYSKRKSLVLGREVTWSPIGLQDAGCARETLLENPLGVRMKTFRSQDGRTATFPLLPQFMHIVIDAKTEVACDALEGKVRSMRVVEAEVTSQ